MNPQKKGFAIKLKNIDDNVIALIQKSTVKVDSSFMAQRIREFYARKAICEQCIEQGNECPYNYDIITCIYGEESIN